MKKLDNFIIRSFIGPFFVTFFLVLFILALQFLWIYIDELVGKGLGLGVIFEFLGWAACTLIPMALPLATLLASIMTLGGLGERNELLAMKAAGIPLQRILSPLIVVSALISVGAFFASNNLIPVSYNKIYTLREDIAKTKEEIKIPTGTFYDGIDGYVLRIERMDSKDMMYGIIIYDHNDRNGNVNVTLADSGRMSITPDKKNLTFDLHHGCSYQEKNRMNYRDTTAELSRVSFDRQVVIISLEDYTFSRSSEDQFGNEVMSKNLKRLRHDRDSLGSGYDSLLVIQIDRLTNTGALEFMHQLTDSTFLTANAGRGLSVDSIFVEVPLQDQLVIYQNALSNIPVFIDQIENCVREDYRYVDPLRRTDIESYRKFALSIACLIFFFIGAPLGAIIRKGGFGTPVIVSIAFFLIYYVIDISGKKLAMEGSLTPLAGTFISSAVLLPIGIFLTSKSTRDSTIFNLDSYKAFFTMTGKFFKESYFKFRNLFRKDFGRIRIVYMGTPEFAVAPLDSLLKAGYDVAAVVTVADKQSGRGMKVSESAVKKYAVEHNIPVLQPEKLKDPAFLEELKAFKANLFVVVAFRMLPKEVWQMPYLGTFNLHASLLPQYRGAAPINWAIINGEKFTGVTTFMIDEQIDTGKIIFQESCNIEDYDNAGTLHDRLQEMGSSLVIKTVEAIRDHRIKPWAQDVIRTELKPAPKLTKELAQIDWSRSAYSINNLIRGLSPYPAAVSNFVAEGCEPLPVKIFEAYVTKDEDETLAPGTITTDGKSFLEVKCGTRSLRILDLQVAGKKRMDIKSFLLGFREAANFRMA